MWFDEAGHHPAVLPDHPVPREAEPFIGREPAVEEEARGHAVGALRVALDGPTAEAGYEVERTGQRRRRHARSQPSG